MSLERLWAPWRREFVEKSGPVDGCIFCEYPARPPQDDAATYILARTPHAFAILNRYPYTSGHVMVIPRRHTANYEELPPDELADLSNLLQRTVALVRAEYEPQGMNLGMNLGRSAGAGIADHLHWHVVPRWTGDTNFMTVTGEVRVLAETLETSWKRLAPRFAAP